MRPDESLFALQSGDGHVLWHAHIDGADGIANSSPLKVDGILYVATGYGALYALHADNGVQLWHVTGARPDQNFIPFIPSSSTFANGAIYLATGQSLYAIRANDGAQIWQHLGNKGPGLNIEQPQIVDGLLYVGYPDGRVQALRPADGTIIWQHNGSQVTGRLTVAD